MAQVSDRDSLVSSRASISSLRISLESMFLGSQSQLQMLTLNRLYNIEYIHKMAAAWLHLFSHDVCVLSLSASPQSPTSKHKSHNDTSKKTMVHRNEITTNHKFKEPQPRPRPRPPPLPSSSS